MFEIVLRVCNPVIQMREFSKYPKGLNASMDAERLTIKTITNWIYPLTALIKYCLFVKRSLLRVEKHKSMKSSEQRGATDMHSTDPAMTLEGGRRACCCASTYWLKRVSDLSRLVRCPSSRAASTIRHDWLLIDQAHHTCLESNTTTALSH